MTRLRMLVALVALVPALAGLVAVGAAADRVDGVGSVPAAVVNADQMAALPDGTPLPAGRLLTAELTDPVDGQLQFNWEIVPADVAATGLAGGDYYAVVTIPEGFSQSIVDMLGGTAQPAQITLEASDPASPLMARVSAEVTQAAADTLGRFFTEEYLAGTLNGSTQLHDAMAQAADGASQLEDGALLASDGALQLSTGSDQLRTGSASSRTVPGRPPPERTSWRTGQINSRTARWRLPLGPISSPSEPLVWPTARGRSTRERVSSRTARVA